MTSILLTPLFGGTVNLVLTIMTNFSMLGALLAIALALVVIASKKRSQ